jgi:PTS system glucose-specific IIC component
MTTTAETAEKQSVGSRVFGQAQKLGKSLMLPVAVLPVAGILLGVGGAFVGGYRQDALTQGFCTVDGVAIAADAAACAVDGAVGDPIAAGIVAEPIFVFLQILQGSGDPIFAALGLIFAIGVALGIARNDGVSALAATVGFLVMSGTLAVVAQAGASRRKRCWASRASTPAFFGGILVGIIAGWAFNKYYRFHSRLLGFFAGRGSSNRDGVRRDRARAGAVLHLPPWGASSRTRRTASSRQRASGGVRVRHRGARAPAVRLHQSGTRRFFFQVNVGGWRTATASSLCFFRGHPESGIFGGGFLVKMFGLAARPSPSGGPPSREPRAHRRS